MNFGNIFILGDSYSTFEGWIPQGYAPYYKLSGHDVDHVNMTDVTNVDETWWKQLINETDATLIRNCSYSGTTICNTGYDGRDETDRSFIARIEKLIKNGFFKENKIDTVFIFGGTNDTWAKSPIGELKYSNWTKEDLYETLPAFCYLLNMVQKNLPDARIVVVMNTGLRTLMHRDMPTACEKYGIDFVELHDIAKGGGHPMVEGMTAIKNQIIEHFAK